MPVWLNEADVRALLPMPDLIELMQTALADFSAGRVNQPVRTVIEVSPKHAVFASMPAHARAIPALGVKLVSVFGENAAKHLPTHLATILLFEPETGALLSVMDGRFITEARTAAVSAVAVRHLALGSAKVLAMIGSGVQARSHLEALPLVREFREVRCWSPRPASVQQLVSECHHVAVQSAPSAEQAVRGADVIVLATSSPAPVIDRAWVKPGACVISVGACRPNQREMDPDLVAAARLIVDSRASALKESGDVIMGMAEGRFGHDHIAAELGEIIAGRESGRTGNEEIAIFKSLGLAIEDVAAAHLVYRRAMESKQGVSFN